MKRCSKCGKRKLLSAFYRDKQKTTGYTSHCKLCMNKQQKIYRQVHKTEAAEYQRKYCKENRNKRREYGRKHYKNNKEKEYKRAVKYKKTLKGYVVHLVAGLLQRCNNQNNIRYENYGGRGIEVCFNSNELFVWLSKRNIDPRGLDIHRIDNDGNYTLNNIEFLTKSKHTILHNLGG